jgi:uncharacterized protein (TIGR03083 family)
MTQTAADRALVDAMADVWSSIGELGDSLDAAEWKTETECPGWSVQDNVAHIVGIESVILGRPSPDHTAPDAPHVRNDVARANEVWVDWYRSRSGPEVLAEFRSVTGERMALLRAADADFDAEAWTPIGPGTVRDMLPFRIFDSFVHEQDMRRALARPGGWDGPAAVIGLDRIAAVMPMIVGKRVSPPEGALVEIAVTGPAARVVAIQIENGRARLTDSGTGEPIMRLELDGDSFVRLGTGRGDPDAILAAPDVEISGDQAMGETLARSMNFMF